MNYYSKVGSFRSEIRELARKHWINTHNPKLAKQLVINSIESKYGSIIASILISLFIKLAVELIMYWFKNNVLEPSPNYQLGEPGYND